MICIALPVLAVAASAADGRGDSATIVNSGSTNTRGYVIRLSRSGTASVDPRDGAAARVATVTPDLADRLFTALDAGTSLDALSSGHCAKSASFGYSIRIQYLGASSPDLTCAVGDKEKKLASLASEVAQAVGLSGHVLRKSPGSD